MRTSAKAALDTGTAIIWLLYFTSYQHFSNCHIASSASLDSLELMSDLTFSTDSFHCMKMLVIYLTICIPYLPSSAFLISLHANAAAFFHVQNDISKIAQWSSVVHGPFPQEEADITFHLLTSEWPAFISCDFYQISWSYIDK